MSQATTRKRWTFDEYVAWEQRQDGKYELVDGDVRAMVGGTRRHDRICNALRRELGNQLRGRDCWVQGPDLKLRAGDNVRYPDALVECGALAGSDSIAHEPVAVFEVLSRSTAWIDQTIKLRDYDAVASIRHYVLISQDEPRVLVYTRDESGRLGARTAHLLEGLSERLVFPELDVAITLADLYEDVTFDL